MNVIVSLMAAGAKKNFSKEEFRRIRKEADAHYRRLVSENKDAPKALKQHTGMNIFPAIAVYKTLVRHGMEKEHHAVISGSLISAGVRIIKINSYAVRGGKTGWINI